MSLNRTPMAAQGSKAIARSAAQRLLATEEAADRKSATMARLMSSTVRKVAPGRISIVCSAVRAFQKEPRERNATLLDMARGKPCLLLSPICVPDTLTTVACHGAGVANGKGLSYKLSDFWTVQGCYQCNHYTDAYNGASSEEKTAVFEAGHIRQIAAWREVIADPLSKPKEKKAAQWAIDRWELAIARKKAKNV